MGDITTVSGSTVKAREGGTSSINCPMLSATNYTVWAIRMKTLLKVHKAWDVIEQETEEIEKNDMAIALIFQSIPEALVLQVGDIDNAKKVWEAIKARHMGADRVKEARLQTLVAEFDHLKMKDNDTIDNLVGKLSEIASKSSALGEIIEETKLVKKFLSSLPRKRYIHIVASLEQVLDLKTTSFKDIIGRLKAYEERVCAEEEEDAPDSQNKLMYTSNEGHFASSCPDRLLKLQEAYETKEDDTHEADALMMHEVVYLNERNVKPKEFETYTSRDNIWYLDNGASNHMTGNRHYFKALDETITGKVRFGDDSRIDIKGKGSILFCTKNGDRKTLADVYFIPELKSNIISLGKATESGCDVHMKEEYLTLHDKDGNLITKAKRSQNRL
ncbi:uncharacterized protein LOC106407215 [Brassica napus]|uniref:uncharacterized protein LOC106407215 n=1 Tax=Brassica napus TaxID=3708 RepID=UPI002079B8F7|nr:uncharacterized protein LOC106407215 [Brassica napus]